MRQKPTEQRQADINAIRAAMAAITEMEQTEILKKQSEAIVNAPGDLTPIPEKAESSVTYSPVDDKGDLLPMPRHDPKTIRLTKRGWLSRRAPRKKTD